MIYFVLVSSDFWAETNVGAFLFRSRPFMWLIYVSVKIIPRQPIRQLFENAAFEIAFDAPSVSGKEYEKSPWNSSDERLIILVITLQKHQQVLNLFSEILWWHQYFKCMLVCSVCCSFFVFPLFHFNSFARNLSSKHEIETICWNTIFPLVEYTFVNKNKNVLRFALVSQSQLINQTFQ